MPQGLGYPDDTRQLPVGMADPNPTLLPPPPSAGPAPVGGPAPEEDWRGFDDIPRVNAQGVPYGAPDAAGRVWGDPGYVDPAWPVYGDPNGWNTSTGPNMGGVNAGATSGRLPNGQWYLSREISPWPGHPDYVPPPPGVHVNEGDGDGNNRQRKAAEPQPLPIQEEQRQSPRQALNRSFFDTKERGEGLFGNAPPRRGNLAQFLSRVR